MPKVNPFEQIDAGGVDSRSNPLGLPKNRALRCLNWVPRNAGFWEQRWGYSTVTMNVVSNSPIHSIFPYRTWDGHKYVLFMSNDKTLKALDTFIGAVTTPTVKGTAIASSAKGSGYFAANRFHYGNGTDQKYFDGTNWRDNGLPALTAAQVLNVTIGEGTREILPAEASAVTLTPAGGGSFVGDTIGRLIYVAIFDPNTLLQQDVGPATISVGPGRVKVGASQKLTVTVLPNLSSWNPNWIKLIAGTLDGGAGAYFFTNTSTNLNSCSRSVRTLTVSATGHGLSTGDVVILAGTVNFDAVYQVTVVDANTFTVTVSIVNTNANTGAVGTVKRIVSAGNAVTSVDVLAQTQDTSYQVNQNRGLAASTIGGPNAGYQLYASIYNPNGGGHVGNRIAIGPRFAETAYRCNVYIYFLPLLSDPEQTILIGRTVDGGSTPYVATDTSGNWAVVQNGQGAILLSQGNTDGNHEMPTRNGIIPPQCNMYAVAGDFVYAADPNSPYLRRSGDMSTNTERGNTFTGRAEQSWAPNDIDTFPTGEATTGIFEVDQEILQGTLHDTAISVNLAGIQQWVGPWAIGIAGMRAGTKCGSWGFYWLTADKQLATLSQGVPVVVSEEYEAAELSQIGTAFISTVELVYVRDASKQKDELRIEAQKTDGTPYTIIHDFKLREIFTPPGSVYGQGYGSQFLGPLGTAFTSAMVRDTNGLQVYAGSSTGQLYKVNSGANDAGTEFNSDLILLVNGGPERPNVPFVDFFGDGNIKMTVGRNLSTSLAPGAEWGFDPPNSDANVAQAVQGAEQDFEFRVCLDPPEVQRLYVRFQLQSHSADGTLALNNPPHVPLESYGRLYELIPAMGEPRDR
jgi:hypothetical protein